MPGRLGVECRHGRLGHRLRSSPLLILLLAAACSATPATSPSGTGAPTPSTSDTTTTPSPPISIVPTPTPESTPTQTPSPTQTQTPTPSPTATPGSVLHTVARGETPSIIAARFDTTWQSLVFWNRERYPGLDPDDARYDPNRIEVGWQLIVWPCVIVPYDAPMPMPSASPRPTSPSSAGTPSTLVSHGSRSSGSVALTFDMGGRTDPAVAIMTWLRDHGVPATVFMTGSSVDTTNATRQVIGIINANPAQFDLGNHSYSHPDITPQRRSSRASSGGHRAGRSCSCTSAVTRRSTRCRTSSAGCAPAASRSSPSRKCSVADEQEEGKMRHLSIPLDRVFLDDLVVCPRSLTLHLVRRRWPEGTEQPMVGVSRK